MSLHIIILAAGQGKRMHSRLPKVLHPVGGTPMLMHVVNAAKALQPEGIHVIYGKDGAELQETVVDDAIHWVHQADQLGTGHAVLQAVPYIPPSAIVLILSADVPLISPTLLEEALETYAASNDPLPLLLLVARVDNPTGLGRIMRDKHHLVKAIVEEKDATPSEREIKEIYTGICAVDAASLLRWLPMLSCQNAQQEYYLTEIIEMAMAEDKAILTTQVHDLVSIQGVNTRLQLAQLERIYQKRLAESLLLAGVGIVDPDRIDIRGELICGKEVCIDVNCVFIGKVIIGNGCKIGPHCVLENVIIGDNTTIHPQSVLQEAQIGDDNQIGPFARIRPGTQTAAHCKVGNFVEIKNSVLGEGSKANHLSYLGDTTVGHHVNIGAGVITCNYDGAHKYATIIEDEAFIGSGTQLVAPVTIGRAATIGAGSTIRKDATSDALTLTEQSQKTISGWKRGEKRRVKV